jgi:hypothetical protein
MKKRSFIYVISFVIISCSTDDNHKRTVSNIYEKSPENRYNNPVYENNPPVQPDPELVEKARKRFDFLSNKKNLTEEETTELIHLAMSGLLSKPGARTGVFAYDASKK